MFAWELRRIGASRANWLIAAGAFAMCFVTVWVDAAVGGAYALPSPHGTLGFVVPYTSVWGLATTLPESPGILFGVFIPFLCTDAVARDWTRRTHDLLLAAPLPGWAYVWGRYLASLLLSFLLACLLLVSIVLVTILLHVARPGSYPPLVLPRDVAVWALIVLPPTVLLGGVSCALGTVLPRHPNLIKVGLLVAWLVGGESLQVFLLRPQGPSWLALWDPTSIAPERQLNLQFFQTLNAHAQEMGVPVFMRYVRVYQQTMPDLHSWVAPHLVWAGAGLLAVAAAAQRVCRFRGNQG